jgi:hypothetical protein
MLLTACKEGKMKVRYYVKKHGPLIELHAFINKHSSEVGVMSWTGKHIDGTISLPPQVEAAMRDALNGRPRRNPVAVADINVPDEAAIVGALEEGDLSVLGVLHLYCPKHSNS